MQSQYIEKIVKYIRNNIDCEITLDDLAEHVNYSKFHLSRTFKKQTGSSIKKYIEAIRVEKGIKKIIEQEESVTDIAYNVGHKSPGTFSNTFKKQTELSPMEYRSESGFAYKFLVKWIKKKNVSIHYENFRRTKNSLSLQVQYPDGYQPKITCAGLFLEAMPKGAPIVGIATVDTLEFTVNNVPDGNYYLFGCEIMDDMSLTKSYVLDQNFRAGFFEPITFSGNSHYQYKLEMRKPVDSDPPININLPVLIMRNFLKYRNS